MDCGFKTGEDRGLKCKVLGPELNYFHTDLDRGLNQWKTGGSLENKPGQTGILGSRPLDLDPSAPGEGVRGI